MSLTQVQIAFTKNLNTSIIHGKNCVLTWTSFLYMVKKVVNRMRGKTFSWHFHVNVLAQLLLFFSIQHQCLVFLFKVDTQLAVLRENFNQNKIKIILKSQASLLLGKLLNIPRTFFYYGPPKSGFAIACSDKHIRCQRDLT